MDPNSTPSASSAHPHLPPGGYVRRFVANVLYGLGARMVQVGVNIFLIGYVIRRLGEEQWGLVVVAITTASLLSLIHAGAAAGISKRLNTFLTRGDRQQFREHYSAGIALCLGMALIIVLGLLAVLFVFWSWFNVPPALSLEGRRTFGAIGAAVVCTTLSLPLVASVQATHRVDVREKLASVGLVLRAVLVVVLFETTGPRASTYAYAFFVVNVLVVLGSWLWVRRNLPEARFSIRGISWSLLRQTLTLNVLVQLQHLNYVVFMQAPTLVLLHTSRGLVAAGLYGIALQLMTLTRMLFVVGTGAIQPVAFSLESTGRTEDLRWVFSTSTKVFCAVSVVIWLWLFLLAEPLFALWLNRDVTPLIRALPWIVAASTIASISLPSASLVIALDKVAVPAITGLVLALLMVAAIVWTLAHTPVDPLMAVGVLLLIFFGAYKILRFFIVTRALHLAAPRAVLDMILRPALAAMGSGLVLWAAYALGFAHSIVQLLVVTLLAGIVLLALGYTLALKPEDRLRLRAVNLRVWPLRQAVSGGD
jgi:O-antigen/teichoic acid export membrane protein